jgi:hypothetical protein
MWCVRLGGAVLVLVFVLLVATTGAARAAIVPLAHDTSLELADDSLVYHATMRIAVEHTGHDPVDEVQIGLPDRGAVVGMRLFDLEAPAGKNEVVGTIMTVDVAGNRFRQLAARGKARPLVVAMLSWADDAALLELTQVAAGQRLAVELDVVGTLLPSDGARARLELPCAGARGVHVADPRITVTSEELVRRSPRGLDRSIEDLPGCEVTVPRRLAHGVRLSFAELPLSAGAFAYLAVEVAAELEPAPEDAHVVFVVDASMSEGTQGVAAELEVVRATAAQFPGGQIAVVAFNHTAKVVTGFVAASALPAALAAHRAQLRVGHGSEAGAGLAAAADLLHGQRGVSRVIVLSDRQLPFLLDGHRLLAAFAAAPVGTVVHVVERVTGSGPPGVARLDRQDHPPDDVGALLIATGGQLVEISGDGQGAANARAMRAATRGLVRPIQLDDAHLVGFFDDSGNRPPALGADGDGTVAEGWGAAWSSLMQPAPRPVRLVARIWGRTVSIAPGDSPDLALDLPLLLMGSVQVGGLEDEEARRLGLTHHVLGPQTSFLAARAQSRPSLLGGDEVGHQAGSVMCSCDADPGTIGGGLGVIGPLAGQAPRQLVAQVLAPIVTRCLQGQAPGQGMVSVEVSGPEILGVWASRTPIAACIEAGVWQAQDTVMGPHATYQLSLAEILRPR